MLKCGDTAPDFELPDSDGNAVRLRDLLAEGPLVVYFYPHDFTPICSAQACAFGDRSAELGAAGVRVVGVSCQSGRSHGRFARRLNLSFALLCDERRRVARAYGAVSLGGLLPRRVSYLIDADRKVVDAVRADLRVGDHAAFIDRVIAWAGDRARVSR
jgi:peroxiredoxin Q/BCP